jgi:iron complex outermembrane recepter protein
MGLSYSRSLAALTASCLIGIPFETQAQAQDPTVAQTGLAEVVVTAQRREENQERVPVSVTALTEATLEAKSIQTESDLQTAVPGLTVQSSESTNVIAFAIRGQTLDFFGSSPPSVLPYINEAQINTLSPSTFYDISSIQVLKGPQGTLFGRNSTGGAVLFSTAAPTKEFGGYVVGGFGNYSEQHFKAALNLPIISDKVLLRIAGEEFGRDGYINNLFYNTHLGEEAHKSGRATLLVTPVEALENSTVFQFSHSGGNNAEGGAVSAYPCGGPNKLLNTTMTCLYGPTLDNVFGPGSWARYLAAHPGVPAEGLYQYITVTQKQLGPYNVYENDHSFHYGEDWFITNKTSYQLSEKITLKNIFSADHSVAKNAGDDDGTPYGISTQQTPQTPPLFGLRTYTKTKDISDELQILGTGLADTLDLVSGVYFSRQKSENDVGEAFLDLAPVSQPIYANPHYSNTSRQIAGYAQATYHLKALLEGLSLTGGFRYTHENLELSQLSGSVFAGTPSEYHAYSKPSWQGGLQEQVTGNWMLYAVTRGSFRSGGFNGLATTIKPALAPQGGNEFAPETTTDVEIGSKFQGDLFNLPARLNIALFRQWVHDIQRVVYVTVNGTITALTANVPTARVQGVEADAELQLARWLDVGATVSFDDAKFGQAPVELFGQTFQFGPFPATPRWSGSFYAQVELPVPAAYGRLSVRGDVYAQSVMYFSSTNDTLTPGTGLSSYHLVDFRMSWKDIAGTSLSVSGFVKNALNTAYYVGGNAGGNVYSLNEATPGIPRTYGMEVEYRF